MIRVAGRRPTPPNCRVGHIRHRHLHRLPVSLVLFQVGIATAYHQQLSRHGSHAQQGVSGTSASACLVSAIRVRAYGAGRNDGV